MIILMVLSPSVADRRYWDGSTRNTTRASLLAISVLPSYKMLCKRGPCSTDWVV